MGVGKPADLVEAVARGVDLFDCVLPTRNARNGQVFTADGPLTISNARFARDAAPLEPECPCEACRRFSRAYLRHLFMARELLAYRLLTAAQRHLLPAAHGGDARRPSREAARSRHSALGFCEPIWGRIATPAPTSHSRPTREA